MPDWGPASSVSAAVVSAVKVGRARLDGRGGGGVVDRLLVGRRPVQKRRAFVDVALGGRHGPSQLIRSREEGIVARWPGDGRIVWRSRAGVLRAGRGLHKGEGRRKEQPSRQLSSTEDETRSRSCSVANFSLWAPVWGGGFPKQKFSCEWQTRLLCRSMGTTATTAMMRALCT